MANFLTQQDVAEYGTDLVDFAQRAAVHALAPTLQQIQEDNAQLRQRLAVEARHRLDQAVERAVPNYREIDRDPRWHQWLLTADPLSGQQRQLLLNDAIASGATSRVISFFRQFQNEATGQSYSAAPGRASVNGPIYTRDQITQLYRRHQQGAYRGREAEWARQEADIIAAGREGRVAGPTYITK